MGHENFLDAHVMEQCCIVCARKITFSDPLALRRHY